MSLVQDLGIGVPDVGHRALAFQGKAFWLWMPIPGMFVVGGVVRGSFWWDPTSSTPFRCCHFSCEALFGPVVKSFSEKIPTYVVVNVLCLWEEVSVGSSYTTIFSHIIPEILGSVLERIGVTYPGGFCCALCMGEIKGVHEMYSEWLALPKFYIRFAEFSNLFHVRLEAESYPEKRTTGRCDGFHFREMAMESFNWVSPSTLRLRLGDMCFW